VSEDGPAAEDLRRAVVARALLTSNLEHAKETGNATGIDRALAIARVKRRVCKSAWKRRSRRRTRKRR